MNHTLTQLPYAAICAVVSFFGFMAAAVTESILVTLVCILVMAVVYLVLAKYKGVRIENLSILDIDKMEQEEA